MSEQQALTNVADRNTAALLPDGRAAGVEGVVLAGVHAWGHGILERVIARPLVPVANRPLIWHILTWLRDAGVGQSSVCANSDTAALHRSLRDGGALHINLGYYEDIMPRGPAGCARDATQGSDAELFVVVDGTILPRIDLPGLLDAHRNSGAALTLVAANCGAAQEPLGIYVFSRTTMQQIPASGYQDIKEGLIPRLYHQGAPVRVFTVPPRSVPRVSNEASYLAVNIRAVRDLVADSGTAGEYVASGSARVHPSARIADNARLLGPVVIGAGCVIEGDALIIGPAVVGPSCHIGPGAIISRSVLWSGCVLEAEAFLDHSILIDDARVAAGVTLRNCVHAPRGRVRAARLNGTTSNKHHAQQADTTVPEHDDAFLAAALGGARPQSTI
ncbi:MAG TPA: NDP-sugar synthase [Phycisphaerae bacterium]